MSETLFVNIKSLYQVREATHQALRGEAMNTCPALSNAFLYIKEGIIADFGTMADLPKKYLSCPEIVDITGKMILPTYVDSHTHLVFAAPRDGEFQDRIHGLSYEEIAERGGGILNSAQKLANKPEEQLFEEAKARLKELIKMGTGAIEIKSGYGLSAEAELKMLRVIKKLKNLNWIPIKATFLGAHALPKAYKEDKEAYLNMLIQEVLPVIEKEQLADYIDIFCEKGYFDLQDTHKILEAGKNIGLKPKIHVNQFNAFGGVQKGVEFDAISVDHLEEMNTEDFETLAQAKTIATALPSCSFFLSIPYAPVKTMIKNNVALALASDFNPGSTPSGNLSFVFSLACIKQKLTPEQALNALTLNAAFAMESEEILGSITKGKKANFMITKEIPSLAFIPYNFGASSIDTVYVNGRIFEE
ncbi:MAG: imidazolonepropionase [Flavobacteriales bacterium]|jgi:imidazolonepropionase|nr:imidazolonepropionase [Flavobacteriales bacterium]